MDPKKLKILICDPDQHKSDLLTKALKEAKVQTITTIKSLDEFQASIENQKPSLIIIGDKFPRMKPIEILRYLKIEPSAKTIPVLLHSSSEDLAMIRELVSEGLVAVIPYPPTKVHVNRALRDYLRRVTSKEISRLVQNSEFFKGFSKEELKTLAKIAIPRMYHVGETIFQKGDPGDNFYILLKGRIETIVMEGSKRTLSIPIEEGSPFGEMAILDRCPRSAFCIAADECIVLEIGSYIIDDQDSTVRHKVLAKLAEVLAARLRHMNSYLPDAGVLSEAPEHRDPQGEEEEEAEANVNLSENPFTVPTAVADEIDGEIATQEEYDVLKRKINLRSDFISAKIPKALRDTICNKMYGYWTGGKLAKLNPHRIWNTKSFMPGSTRLKNAMHLVVVHPRGLELYEEAFLGLPFSHRAVGISNTGCVGTFLGTREATRRFLENEPLEMALQGDLEMPIDRVWRGNECIEYLTHTSADVRDQTLFLIFDTESGHNTLQFRERFPEHQIVTIVPGKEFNPDEPASVFTMPEELLTKEKALLPKADFNGEGFYQGETVFLPDFSHFFEGTDKLRTAGNVFATVGIFAQFGPDYSGITWGSKGGAEGAVKAARAMYGMAGAQSAEDLASAVSWADN